MIPATPQETLLKPMNALRIYGRRTGVTPSTTSWYRWLDSGKIMAYRMNSRIMVPWEALEESIKAFYEGYRL